MADEDRLSQLPSHIIELILSFMTTKTAIKNTSVLSKRWRYAWTTCPTLIFENLDLNKRLLKAPKSINFVDKVLELCSQYNITTFILYWFEAVDHSKVSEWVKYAIQHNVEELVLYIHGKDKVEIPGLFHCPNLKRLKLIAPSQSEIFATLPPLMSREVIDCSSFLQLPSSINLKNIRYLDLAYMEYSSASLNKLLSSCPLLEYLLITAVSDNLKICVPNVQTLHLNCCGASVQILAPKLVSLNCGLYEIPEILMGSLQFLVNAKIWYYEKQEGSGNKLINFLKKLSNAKNLKLTGAVIESLSAQDLSKKTFPLFCNLKSIKIETLLNTYNIDVIIMLLQKTRSLEKLVIYNTETNIQLNTTGPKDDRVITPEDVCNFTGLKKIKIRGFLGDIEECKLVKFLLKKGKFLQRMSISCYKLLNIEAQHNISKKLLTFSRASSDAKLFL